MPRHSDRGGGSRGRRPPRKPPDNDTPALPPEDEPPSIDSKGEDLGDDQHDILDESLFPGNFDDDPPPQQDSPPSRNKGRGKGSRNNSDDAPDNSSDGDLRVIKGGRSGRGSKQRAKALDDLTQDDLADLGLEVFKAKRDQVKDVVLPDLQQSIEDSQAEIDAMRSIMQALKKRYGLDDSAQQESAAALTAEQREMFKKRVVAAEQYLPQRVIGQDHVHPPIIEALKRAATGTADENRPIASMLLLGPTGTGKTLTAKALAEALSGDGQGFKFDFLKIDCSEYQAGHEGARLTGSPPGYIGYEESGQLKALAKNPYHVLLFDEIEKGSRELHNLLLQAVEDGQITLGNGQKVSTKRCIILMTGNVGAEAIQAVIASRGLGFTQEKKDNLDAGHVKSITDRELHRTFKPEFLNRLDLIASFRTLGPAEVLKIAQNEVQHITERTCNNNGCTISVAPEVIALVAKEGFAPQWGAREIRRKAEENVGNTLATALFNLDQATIAKSHFSVSLNEQGGITIRRSETTAAARPLSANA